jgi:hypothetical protein
MKNCIECGIELTIRDQSSMCCKACRYGNEDEDDYYERQQEEKENELAERATSCDCGAWQFANDGSVIHVADCCCGAE